MENHNPDTAETNNQDTAPGVSDHQDDKAAAELPSHDTQEALLSNSDLPSQKTSKRKKIILTIIVAIVLAILCYVALKPDAAHLAAVSLPRDKTIVFVDPLKLRIIKTQKLDFEPDAIAFSPKCDQIAVSDSNTNKIYIYNLPSFSLAGSFEIDFHPLGFDWNPPTPNELICFGEGVADQISFNIKRSMASNSIAEGVVVPRGVLEVEEIHKEFAPRSDTNVNQDINILIDQNLNEVIASRGDTSKPITTIPVGKRPTEIGWDRNRRYCFVVVTGEDNIAIIDIKTLKVTKKIKTFKEPEKFMILRHTNMVLICSRLESSLALFNLSSKKIVKTLKLPGQFSCLAVWPNPQFDEEELPANSPNEHQRPPEPPEPNRQPPAPGMQPPGPPRDMSHPQPRNFTAEDNISVPPAQGIPQSPAPGSPESPAPGTPQPPPEAKPPSGETPAPGIPIAPAPGTPKEPEHSAPANDIPKPGTPKEPAPGNPEEPISGAVASPAASASPPANAAGNNMQH